MIRLGEEGYKMEHFRYPWHFHMEKEIWRSFLAQKRNIFKQRLINIYSDVVREGCLLMQKMSYISRIHSQNTR